MLVSAALLLLLSGQRPGVQSRQRVRTVSPQVQVKRVTGAYFRMHDPAFVAQALENADSAGGRAVAASVLSPDLLSNRTVARNRLGSYRRGVSVGKTIVPNVRVTAGKGISPTTTVGTGAKYATANGLFGYHDLVPQGLKKTAGRYLGAVALGAATPFATFHGVASKDGDLKVLSAPNTPFRVAKLRVETGEVEPTGLAAALSGNYYAGTPVKVLAGQEWTVDVAMETGALGDFKSYVEVDDGGTNRFSVRGKVVPAQGELAFWTESCFAQLAPGSSQTVNLRVKAQGTGPTKVFITASSDRPGISLSGFAPVTVSGSKEVVVPVTVKVAQDAEDGVGSLLFKASAFDGTKTAMAEGLIKVQTIWSTTGTVTAGGTQANSATILRYANSGYWSMTSFQNNLTDTAHSGYVLFVFEGPGKYNANLGQIMKVGGLIGGKLAAKGSQTFEQSGVDPRLRLPLYLSAKTKNWAMYLGEDPYFSQDLAYWIAHQLDPYLLDGLYGK